jgi:hypothetical protein
MTVDCAAWQMADSELCKLSASVLVVVVCCCWEPSAPVGQCAGLLACAQVLVSTQAVLLL